MARFIAKEGQIVSDGQTAKGIFVQDTVTRVICWYSKDGDVWAPLNGNFDECDCPLRSTGLFTHNMGWADSISEFVHKWNRETEHLKATTYCAEWLVGSELLVSGDLFEVTADVMNGGVRVVVPAAPVELNEFIVDRYESEKIYTGQGSYHSHHGSYLNEPTVAFTGHRIGVELEIECNNEDDLSKVKKLKSNWFYQERDGSLGSYGDEIVTIPLLPDDAKSVAFWRPLCDKLSKHAQSWQCSRTGLHVHIGRELLGSNAEEKSETLGKLLYLYHHIILNNDAATELNTKIYGRSRGYSEKDGKTEYGKAVSVIGSEILKEKVICDRLSKAMKDRTNTDRYFDINTQNTATIEFRKGKGSINPERITAIIGWCEAMVKYARTTEWIDLSFDGLIDSIRNDSEAPISLLAYLSIDK